MKAVLILVGLIAVPFSFGRPINQAEPVAATYVQVVTAIGKSGPDLQPADLEIRDKGKVVSVSAVHRVTERSVVVLVDLSGSLMERSNEIVDGALTFVGALPSGSTVRAGLFADRIAISPAFSDNGATGIADLLKQRPFGNGSRIFDSLVKAMDVMANERKRRTIVLISDGDDTSSRTNETAIRSRAQQDDVAITTLALELIVPPQLQTRIAGGFTKTPKNLAEATGGGYYPIAKSPAGALLGSARRAAEDMRSEYIVEFAPAVRDGKKHDLDVRSLRPGVTIRARRSYVAPPA